MFVALPHLNDELASRNEYNRVTGTSLAPAWARLLTIDTAVLLLDGAMRPVPTGMPGEVYFGACTARGVGASHRRSAPAGRSGGASQPRFSRARRAAGVPRAFGGGLAAKRRGSIPRDGGRAAQAEFEL